MPDVRRQSLLGGHHHLWTESTTLMVPCHLGLQGSILRVLPLILLPLGLLNFCHSITYLSHSYIDRVKGGIPEMMEHSVQRNNLTSHPGPVACIVLTHRKDSMCHFVCPILPLPNYTCLLSQIYPTLSPTLSQTLSPTLSPSLCGTLSPTLSPTLLLE